MWLQSPEGDAAVQLALANPEKYVLKPQREGGGEFNFRLKFPKCPNADFLHHYEHQCDFELKIQIEH